MLIRRIFSTVAIFLGVVVSAGKAPAAEVRNFELVNVRLAMTLEQATTALAGRGFTYKRMVHGIWPNLLPNQYSYSHKYCISESTVTEQRRDLGSCIDQLVGVGPTPDTTLRIQFAEDPDRHGRSVVYSVDVTNAFHSRGPLERERLRSALFKKFGPATEESSPVDDALGDSKEYFWCTHPRCVMEDHLTVSPPSLVLNMGLTEAALSLSDRALKDRADADLRHAADLNALKQSKPSF